jgi:hypothetical protein
VDTLVRRSSSVRMILFSGEIILSSLTFLTFWIMKYLLPSHYFTFIHAAPFLIVATFLDKGFERKNNELLY